MKEKLKNLKERKLYNILMWCIIFGALYFIAFFLAGFQLNIVSKTLIPALLLIHIELIFCLIYRNHYAEIVVASIAINLLALSFYLRSKECDIKLYLLFLSLSCLVLLLNRPFSFLVKKIAYLLHILDDKLKPVTRISTCMLIMGSVLIGVLFVSILFSWSHKINKDYPYNYLEQICVHEAGHAVVSERLFPGEVTEVVLNPRINYEFFNLLGLDGVSYGYVSYSGPSNDTLLSPRIAKDVIKRSLAGQLATIHFYGEEHLLGGGGDMPNAHKVAQKYLLLTYTKELGTINSLNYDKKQLISSAKAVVDSQVPETELLVENNSELIKIVADNLKEKKRITGEELREIIDDYDKHTIAPFDISIINSTL